MKVIESPVKKWPGTVTLPDYLTVPQAVEWEEAFDNANAILPECEPLSKDKPLSKEQAELIDTRLSAKWLGLLLPGIKACVLEWNLQGLDPDNFPATPKTARIELVAWLIKEIGKLYSGIEIPNA